MLKVVVPCESEEFSSRIPGIGTGERLFFFFGGSEFPLWADTFVHEQRATEGLSIANHNGSASCLALKADVHVKRHWGRNLSRNCFREMRYNRLGRSILGLVKAAIDQSLNCESRYPRNRTLLLINLFVCSN